MGQNHQTKQSRNASS